MGQKQVEYLQSETQSVRRKSRERRAYLNGKTTSGNGKAKQKEALGEIETLFPGYLGSQDTDYVGNIKGVGKVYQQTFIDTYSKVAMCKLYDRKNALVAADLLNDRVIPFFEEQEVKLLRMLTD